MNSGSVQLNSRAKRARGEHRVELRDRRRRKAQRPEICAQPLGQLFEDARDFGCFVFGELHELVVELNRFERLDENRLAGRARGVHDALHLPPLRRAHGDDEAVVAQRDVVFAGSPPRARRMRSSVFCTVSRVRPMLPRMRFSSGEASSLISPFGSTAWRMAAAEGAEIGDGARAAARRGNFPAGVNVTEVSRMLVGTVAEALAQPRNRVRQRRRGEQHPRREHGGRRFEFREPRSGSASEPKPISLPSRR